MVFASDDSFLSSDHSFWCIQKLNPKYLIQLLETLPVELTEIIYFLKKKIYIYIYIYIIFSSQSDHKTYQFKIIIYIIFFFVGINFFLTRQGGPRTTLTYYKQSRHCISQVSIIQSLLIFGYGINRHDFQIAESENSMTTRSENKMDLINCFNIW